MYLIIILRMCTSYNGGKQLANLFKLLELFIWHQPLLTDMLKRFKMRHIIAQNVTSIFTTSRSTR